MTDINAPKPAPEPEHSPPGGTVHETGLNRRAGKLTRLPCGCTSDDTRHLTFCDKVFSSLNEIRARWRAAHGAVVREADIDPLLR